MEKATITKSVLMKKTRTHGEINLKEIKTEGGVMKMIGGNGNKKMAFELVRRKRVHFRDMNPRRNHAWRIEDSTVERSDDRVSALPGLPTLVFLDGRVLKEFLEKLATYSRHISVLTPTSAWMKACFQIWVALRSLLP
jgi:hypothetical protein